MPELPEVEGVVRSLAPIASGRTIRSVTISETVAVSKAAGKEAIVKGHSVEQFSSELADYTIEAVTRRSKYIYFHLIKEGRCRLLVSHLGMTGAWFVVNAISEIREQKFRTHIHAIFHLEDGGLLVYSDIRRFGELRLLTCEEDHVPLTLMAPEPFDADAEEFLSTNQLKKSMRKDQLKK